VPPLQLPVKADSVELRHAEIAENEVILLSLDLLEGQPALSAMSTCAFVGQELWPSSARWRNPSSTTRTRRGSPSIFAQIFQANVDQILKTK